MTDILVMASIAAWWGVAVVIFAILLGEIGDVISASEVVAVAVFWPGFAVMGLIVVLWRVPFKTTRAIRIDLKNRGLMNEFDEFMAARKKREADEIAASAEQDKQRARDQG